MSGEHTVTSSQSRLLQRLVRYGKGALIVTVSSKAAMRPPDIHCGATEGQNIPPAAMHPAPEETMESQVACMKFNNSGSWLQGTLSLLGTAVAVSNAKVSRAPACTPACPPTCAMKPGTQQAPCRLQRRSQKATKLPDKFVLELDLENVQVVEQQPSPFRALTGGGSPPALHLLQVQSCTP